jgi:hypothetical protein
MNILSNAIVCDIQNSVRCFQGVKGCIKQNLQRGLLDLLISSYRYGKYCRPPVHLAQDRDQCRASVNTIMNLRVP